MEPESGHEGVDVAGEDPAEPEGNEPHHVQLAVDRDDDEVPAAVASDLLFFVVEPLSQAPAAPLLVRFHLYLFLSLHLVSCELFLQVRFRFVNDFFGFVLLCKLALLRIMPSLERLIRRVAARDLLLL